VKRLRVFLLRLWAVVRSQQMDRDMNDEIASHLAEATDEYVQQGLSREDARVAALRSFGSVTQTAEHHRDARSFVWVDHLGQDLRYGFRALRRSPAFAASAVLSLALGIGANTAIFSVLDAVMFRSLPVVDPERLVVIRTGGAGIVSYPVLQDLQAQQQVCSGLLATTGPQRLSVRRDASTLPRRVMGTQVSSNYFSVLGATVPVGRGFTPEDERVTAGRVVVISDSLWNSEFLRNPSVLGQTIQVSGAPAVIVGVAPSGFEGEVPGLASDLWLLIAQFRTPDELRNRAGSFFQIMGRLRPEVSAEQAQSALTFLYQRSVSVDLGRQSATAMSRGSASTDSYIALDPGGRGLQFLQRQFARALLILLAIVALVLLVACANIATLLLARAVARQHEIAVRLALGASRWRLIRQLLTESLLLACCGGAGGLILAWVSGGLLTTLLAGGLLPLTLNLTPDVRVMLFTGAVSIGTGVLFGVVPALQATEHRVSPSVSVHGRVQRANPPRQRLVKVLVASQMALSLVLLVTAALLVTSVRNLHEIEPGFDRDGVLLADVHTDQPSTAAALTAFSVELRERMMALPGVVAVSFSWIPLFDPFTDLSAPLSIDGYLPRQGEKVMARYNAVSWGYFEAVGMKVLAGRGFTSTDADNAQRVLVVNERFVRQYFGGQDPLGKVVSIAVGPKSTWQPREVVGVVGDAKYNDLRRETRPLFYVPLVQLVRPVQSVEIRTAGAANPIALGPTVRHVLSEIAPQLIVDDVRTVAQQVDRPIAMERLVGKLSASFGILAMTLAAFGLYGLLSYSVARRTSEIGVRMALGASRSRLLWLVLRESMALVTAGTASGLVLAIAATRVVSRYLFGLTATDPFTITMASVTLIAVALAAAYVPARRASRIDPIVALRTE
jgi:predicted permease